MKALYSGPHGNNWYGIDLCTGATIDVPARLESKVKSNPNFKIIAEPAKVVKKAVKKSVKKAVK